MRSKRRILLIDSDETRQSLMRFVLVQHGYAVTSASDIAKAKQCAHGLFDLTLAHYPIDERAVAAIAEATDSKALLLCEHGDEPREDVMHLTLKAASTEKMLEVIRLFTIRKKGPRPMKKPPVSAHSQQTQSSKAAA
jgi:CheY-like chemotaxis protein